jgi:hypothetical protein
MVAFNKFNSFIEGVFEGEHNFATHAFKVVLTNSAPIATNSVLANITQIANGNGYTTGGTATTISASSQTSGTYKAVASDVVFTATGAMGPFRYAVLYNDTHASDALVGWWDYGSAVTLATGETFTVDFDPTNGVIQAT